MTGKLWGKLLNESFIGLAGDSTAIGDAIGQAIKRLRENNSHQRVLILMTDGANTAGAVTPLKAAELAAVEKLKIYTIGIGADEIIVRDFFGARRVNPSQDLDEKTLKAIAEKNWRPIFSSQRYRRISTNLYIIGSTGASGKRQTLLSSQNSLVLLATGRSFSVVWGIVPVACARLVKSMSSEYLFHFIRPVLVAGFVALFLVVLAHEGFEGE